MLPNHVYPIPKCEPLRWIIRNRRIHCCMPDRNTGRCCNHPAHMLICPVPHLDPEREIAGNVVQVRIG